MVMRTRFYNNPWWILEREKTKNVVIKTTNLLHCDSYVPILKLFKVSGDITNQNASHVTEEAWLCRKEQTCPCPEMEKNVHRMTLLNQEWLEF